MKYEVWRDEIFGQPAGTDPYSLDLSEDFYGLLNSQILDYIDRALIDQTIHSAFCKSQIGIGLTILFSSGCSDCPFAYIDLPDVTRKQIAVDNLKYLYTNFFDRYCTADVISIGNSIEDGEIGQLCYMFWDGFVLNSLEQNKEIVNAALNTMTLGLRSKCDNSITSAIHGLGHWVLDASRAASILNDWLAAPTTNNTEIIRYAMQAKAGYIL